MTLPVGIGHPTVTFRTKSTIRTIGKARSPCNFRTVCQDYPVGEW